MTEKKEYATISFGTEPDIKVFAKEMCDGYVYVKRLYAMDRNDPESGCRTVYSLSIKNKEAEYPASLLLSKEEMMRLRRQIMCLTKYDCAEEEGGE